MSDSRASGVSSRVDALVSLLLPSSAEHAARRARVRAHLLRVLGSVLGSTRVGAGSEPAIVESTKKALLRGGGGDGRLAANTSKQAMRYQELVARVQRAEVLRNRWAVFHLLKQLMGAGGDAAAGGAAAPARSAGGIGIGVSVGASATAGISVHQSSSSSSSSSNSTSAVVDDMIYGGASIPARAAQGSRAEASRAERRRRRLVEPTRFVLDENLGEELSEQALLRDVIYAFQGIDGKYVRWSHRANGYVVDPRAGVPQAVRTLVGKLCEMGWLFRRVREYIRRATTVDHASGEREEHGLVGQSLCFALQEELNDYYRLVAILEAQIQQQEEEEEEGQEQQQHHQQEQQQQQDDAGEAREGTTDDGTASRRRRRRSPPSMSALTLRRLYVWAQEPLNRLRLMASIVDSTRGLRGAALASAVDGFSWHGDPSVRMFVQRLMRELCAPLYAMLRRWLFEGELQDPHGEFFVQLGGHGSGVGHGSGSTKDDPPVLFKGGRAVASAAGTLMWHRKYAVRPSMLPSWWITTHPEMASRILLIGKSLNFIRQTCKDSEWVLDVSTTLHDDKAKQPGGEDAALASSSSSFSSSSSLPSPSSASSLSAAGREFEYGHNDMLMRTVERALSATNARLLELVFKKYKLIAHLSAIKRYLLLGQGDFAQHLMDALQPELSKRASRLFRHALLAHVDGAIRASNAQFDDPEVLERIDVKILHASPGDDGWKVFTLDYRVGGALDAILSESAMANYLQVFRFLWRIKRVENSLSSLWQRTANTSHVLLRSVPEVRGILHKCALLRNEMQHVTSIFLSYMMYEVLETGWLLLQSNLAKATSLDDLIAAHESYQRDILSAALLDKPTIEIRRQLHVIFDRLLRFCDTQKRVLDTALELSHEKSVREQQIYEKSRAGRWGLEAGEFDDETSKEDLSSRARALSDQVEVSYNIMHRDFRVDMIRLSFLLQQSQNNQGSSRSHRNLRFLAVRMDFNNFYGNLAEDEREEKERISRQENMRRREEQSEARRDGEEDEEEGLSVVTGLDASRVMGSALRASQLRAAETPDPTNKRTWGEGPPPSGASSWAGSPLVPFDDDGAGDC